LEEPMHRPSLLRANRPCYRITSEKVLCEPGLRLISSP
jgi:hypothetical protein